MDEQMATHTIEYEHVKGHAGNIENERCDELAVEAYQKCVEKGDMETRLRVAGFSLPPPGL